MSPRAAWRLETLGFTRVYDYAGGKTDWAGSGYPTEGSHANLPTPGSLARPMVTCSLDDRLGQILERVEAKDAKACIVTNDDGIVLGRLREKDLSGDLERTAQEVMEPGPTTVRYDESLLELVHRMQHAGVGSILVTEPSGKLIGSMYRREVEELLEEAGHDPDEHHH